MKIIGYMLVDFKRKKQIGISRDETTLIEIMQNNMQLPQAIIPITMDAVCPKGPECSHCDGFGEDADGRPCPEMQSIKSDPHA